MLSFVESILASLIAVGVGFLLGSIYQRHVAPKVRRRRHVLGSLLHFDLKKDLTVTYGYVLPSTEQDVHSIEQGDLIAVVKAYHMATAFCHPDTVYLENAKSLRASLGLQENILSVSGPKWNPVTAYYLGALGSPIEFSVQPRALVVRSRLTQTRDIYPTDREGRKLARVCHGVILAGSLMHPVGRMQHVLLCAGRTTLSTNACLLFLNLLASSPERLRDLKTRGVTGSGRWGLLLRVENTAAGERLDELLNEGDVDMSVLRVFLEADFLDPYRVDYPLIDYRKQGE